MPLVSFILAWVDDGIEEGGSERNVMGDRREGDVPLELREQHVSC